LRKSYVEVIKTIGVEVGGAMNDGVNFGSIGFAMLM
jgi:hypothetical protein